MLGACEEPLIPIWEVLEMLAMFSLEQLLSSVTKKCDNKWQNIDKHHSFCIDLATLSPIKRSMSDQWVLLIYGNGYFSFKENKIKKNSTQGK